MSGSHDDPENPIELQFQPTGDAKHDERPQTALDVINAEPSTLAHDVAIESEHSEEDKLKTKGGVKMGTIPGVLLPCLQNIFGIILFLRQAWITGESGFFVAFAVVFGCCLTTFTTALSMAAVATNGRVGAGGTYFMISRTLGPEFGGSVGLSFYLATTLAGAMYVLGAVETILVGLGLKKWFGFQPQVMGEVILLLTVLIVLVGVKLVAKVGPLFLLCVIIGIVCMWLGIFLGTGIEENPSNGVYSIWKNSQFGDNLWPSDNFKSGKFGLSYMFGLFFPSCTGIMAGANRSTVLANPSVSIPRGTLLAISITSVVYLINILLFAATATREKLVNLESLIVADVAFPHPMVVQLAVLLSTLGAGMQSITGAPFVLQAIVNDDIIPFLSFLKEPPEKASKPRKTLLMTMIICGLAILPGNLDIVTPIVTMFFIMFYMFTNLACLVLTALKAPNFRPTFRFYNAFTAFMGFALCVFIMFLINVYAALGAMVFAALLYQYILHFGAVHDWGDGFVGLRLQSARFFLLRVDGYGPLHYKNWRPQVLCLTKLSLKPGQEEGKDTIEIEEPNMVAFIRQLKKGSGLTVFGTVVQQDFENMTSSQSLTDIRENAIIQFQRQRANAFVEVVADKSLASGYSALIQVAGLGRFQPNMVSIGWPKQWREGEENKLGFLTALNLCELTNKGVLVFKDGSKPYPTVKARKNEPKRGSIDIWWKPHGGGLLILIPHLLRNHKVWANSKIRVFTICGASTDSDRVKKSIKRLFDDLRFSCEVITVEFDKSQAYTTYSYPRTMLGEEAKALAAKAAPTTKFGKGQLHAALDRAEQASTAPSELKEASSSSSSPKAHLDLEVARALNARIRQESGLDGASSSSGANAESPELLMLNLPRYKPHEDDPDLFMEYVQQLTEGFPPTLLVKDSGREVTTSVF
eukprot:TRINITY_DN61341_c0_g1_i1.p1 TRINITY_DN61341_c0_g1~~TRINITY_DN61341_c0_g1_i1.p1  ORF type:complete len:923 (+),score=100.53 TRINITY_DN61341_c0_g1_i1:52-2820(+)